MSNIHYARIDSTLEIDIATWQWLIQSEID